LAWTTRPRLLEQQKERIFATKSALTSKDQRRRLRSEVVLEQAILGLLINGRQGVPWGIKE